MILQVSNIYLLCSGVIVISVNREIKDVDTRCSPYVLFDYLGLGGMNTAHPEGTALYRASGVAYKSLLHFRQAATLLFPQIYPPPQIRLTLLVRI